MSKAAIWAWLKQNTDFPDVSIAGIMGNMEAESNCEACRLQGDFSNGRVSSVEYAKGVDSGAISVSTFSFDSKGWGLCQWTYFSRKDELLSYCKEARKSIADETAQLEFMMQEMTRDFPTLVKALKIAQTVGEAASLFCRNFEKPAVMNTETREKFGLAIYTQFHGTVFPETENEIAQEWVESLESDIKGLEDQITVKKGLIEKIRRRFR